MTQYGENFFKDQQDLTRKSAEAIVPLLMEWVQPTSVIDIGCALGEWLSVFRERGVEKVLGMDGEYVDQKWLQIPQDCFVARDLSQALNIDGQFDLAMCLEVAEHLSEARAQELVAALTKLSDVVMFSAAVPGQGGVHHVNEQWQDYWANRFAAKGFVTIDCIRPRIWNNDDVRWWYAQNTLMFVRESALRNYPALAELRNDSMPLRLVHPKMYLGLHGATRPENVRVSVGLSQFLNVCGHSIRRRLKKSTNLAAKHP